MTKQARLAEWKHLNGGDGSVNSIAPTLHPASATATQWAIVNLNALTLHHATIQTHTHFKGRNLLLVNTLPLLNQHDEGLQPRVNNAQSKQP